MSFNSLEFLIFLPCVTLLYYLLPHRFRWILLLSASYFFYMSWNASLVFLIAGVTLVSWGAGYCIPKAKKTWLKKLLLVSALVICLGVLFFFKYFDFMAEQIVNLIHLFTYSVDDFALGLILPVGISFYTFQTLSYVIDVYQERIPAERHLGYYALFVSFFPQLVAGPIERPEHLLPQLKEEHTFCADYFQTGIRLLFIGFFKKVVIADMVGAYVDSVFAAESPEGLAVLLAGFLFSFQIYCDFSGYSDIATGAAALFGIRLMKNFDRPFLATSVKDFVRRWHISLNSWFRDYLYFPLGGSRKGKWRAMLNVLIVFALSGLWHGAAWTFVLWGVFMGVAQIVESLVKKPVRALFEKRGWNLRSPASIAVRRILVFSFVSFCGLAFRSASLAQFGDMVARLFTQWGVTPQYFASAFATLNIDAVGVITVLLSIACLGLLPRLEPRERDVFKRGLPLAEGAGTLSAAGGREKTTAKEKPLSFTLCFSVILCIALGWLWILSQDDVSAFLYFQF